MNATEKVCSGRSIIRAISAAIALLSMPPDRNMPSGTSLIRRSRTDSSSSSPESLDDVAAVRSATGRGGRDRSRIGTSQYCRVVIVAVFEDEQVPGQQLVDAAEQRLRAGDVARAEHLGQHRLVGLRLDQAAGEDRLDLRSEEQRVAGARPVERLDAEAIADQQQPALRRVPDREREHAAEAVHAVVAPLLVGVDDGFGVGLRAVAVAVRLELARGSRRGCRSRR